jgi:phage/plasmid primase-like uncharacterized protein
MIEITASHLAKISLDLGAEITPFPIDNNFHHFTAGKKGSKPIWAIGRSWDYKGNTYYIIQYGDFRGGSKFQLSNYDVKEQTATFKKHHNEQMKQLEEKNKREREEKRQAGIDKYKKQFYECQPNGPVSEYLKRKQIDSNYMGRVNYRNTLFIPVENYLDEKITFEGVQMIFRDDETGAWKKVFNTGLVKKGAFTRVSDFDIRKTEIIYLCEGYATACSVFMATGVPTICAFDSGNLGFVIETIKIMNPDIKVIICADDDFQTVINGRQFNVGINKALECQKKFQNVTYRKPIFGSRINETDFNDLHILEGLEIVREQLKINRGEFTDVILLGHVDHNEFYYLSTQSKTIINLKGHQHKGEHLKAIANEKFWAEKYGSKKDKDGNVQPNWTKIADTLLERQRDIGPFDLKKMRGLGVWDDEGRIFVNIGSGVYSSERQHVMSNIDPHLATKNFYKNEPSDMVNFDDELTDEECLAIIKAFQHLRFKNEFDFFYVTGFLAIANCFAALNWRPHLWVSGPAGSGKSWTLKQMGKLIHYRLPVKGSTVSGIKQELNCHAKCVVYDEAEASQMLDSVVELARQCSTKNDDKILRGTTFGQAISYEANACFLMGSIEPPRMNKADDSRFFLIEMIDLKDQTNAEFDLIHEKFKAIEGMGKRLMVRCVKNFTTLLKNIELCKKMLREKGVGSREADQLATIMGGFVLMNTKGIIGQALFDEVFEKVGIGASDYTERNESDTTGDDAYWNFMSLQIGGPGNSLTIADCVEKARNGANSTPELAAHGIEWVGGEKLFVASNNANFDAKMERIGVRNFRMLVKRSEFFVETKKMRVKMRGNKSIRGIILRV